MLLSVVYPRQLSAVSFMLVAADIVLCKKFDVLVYEFLNVLICFYLYVCIYASICTAFHLVVLIHFI